MFWRNEIRVNLNPANINAVPGAGLSKYRHQASHRNCAGTPSTLFGCIQQDHLQSKITPSKFYCIYPSHLYNAITGILYDNQNITYGTSEILSPFSIIFL